MGTAILLCSHDCLQGRLSRDALSLTTSQKYPNSNPNQTRGRKRNLVTNHTNFQDNSDRSRCRGYGSMVVVKGPRPNLVMGQVKILKRGEKLTIEDELQKTKKKEEGFDLALVSTDRLGPDPEMVKEQIRVPDLKAGMYAGTAFMASPPPSSVPVPLFLRINRAYATATDTRRLARFHSI